MHLNFNTMGAVQRAHSHSPSPLRTLFMVCLSAMALSAWAHPGSHDHDHTSTDGNHSTACSTTNEIFPRLKFDTCHVLEGSSMLHWRWTPETKVLRVAFSMVVSSVSDNYIGWGINEEGRSDMEPSNVVICYQINGVLTPKQYYLSAMSPSGVNVGGKLNLSSLMCGYNEDTSSIVLSFSVPLESPEIATIWAKGNVLNSAAFKISEHCNACHFAAELYDFSDDSAAAVIVEADDSELMGFKRVHGFMSATGWGILIPLGAMTARYLKPLAGPIWFHFHPLFQAVGYLLGTVGFAMGIRLHYWGHRDKKHLTLAIVIFVIASLQILSSLLKPDLKSNHRVFWNLYHWVGGYVVIIVAVINIFIGFHLLEDYGDWRTAYIVLLCVLAGLSLVLEIVTWATWSQRKAESEKSTEVEKLTEHDGNSKQEQD